MHDRDGAIPSLTVLQRENSVSVMVEPSEHARAHRDDRMRVAASHECRRQRRVEVVAREPEGGEKLVDQALCKR